MQKEKKELAANVQKELEESACSEERSWYIYYKRGGGGEMIFLSLSLFFTLSLSLSLLWEIPSMTCRLRHDNLVGDWQMGVFEFECVWDQEGRSEWCVHKTKTTIFFEIPWNLGQIWVNFFIEKKNPLSIGQYHIFHVKNFGENSAIKFLYKGEPYIEEEVPETDQKSRCVSLCWRLPME